MTKDEKNVVSDLLELEEGLSDWEIDFLDNLYNNFADRELSPKQRDVLCSLSEKHL